MRVIGLGACLLVLAANPLGAADKEAKFDAEKLVGKWEYVSGEKAGEKVDAERFKSQTVTITKETVTLKSPDATFVMKYELDTTKKPVTIKLTMTESPFGAGAVAHGIIELEGDNLKMCYNKEGDEAPKKFETKGNDKGHLFVLKRTK